MHYEYWTKSRVLNRKHIRRFKITNYILHTFHFYIRNTPNINNKLYILRHHFLLHYVHRSLSEIKPAEKTQNNTYENWITDYKILTFIFALPKVFMWKMISYKFKPIFLCFSKSLIWLSLISWYSINSEC